ncbi:MAG: response regulator [Patescibacteria group bacterium]
MNKTILIIEDDDFVVKAYQVKLEREGFSVLTIMDGNEALSHIKKATPADLVILDLMLPGVSGFDVLTEIRKNEKWKKTPVVIMSNLGQEQDIKRCQEIGISDYIIKSDIKISEVVERVKNLLS